MRPRSVTLSETETIAVEAAMNALQGTDSPEGVVTGYVADQPYQQFHETSHSVVATWQFRGTVGENTGWVQVWP